MKDVWIERAVIALIPSGIIFAIADANLWQSIGIFLVVYFVIAIFTQEYE